MKICKIIIKQLLNSSFPSFFLHHILTTTNYSTEFFFRKEMEKNNQKMWHWNRISSFSQTCHIFLPHPFTSLIDMPFNSIKNDCKILTRYYLLCPSSHSELWALLTELVLIVSGGDAPRALELVHRPMRATFGFFRFISAAQRIEPKRASKTLLWTFLTML